jgi:hypothetical protein
MVKFKKATKKRGAIRTNNRDNDDEEEEDSALDAIQSTQKRQKLMQSTLYKRGLDANLTLKPVEPKKVVEEKSTANDAEKSLYKTTFSSTENGPTETVMEQKHLSAMEEFINRRINPESTNEEDKDEKGYTEDSEQEREADMGAGGTMLGGTGIAEVILPVEKRLQTAKQTEELRASLPVNFGKQNVSSAGYHIQKSDVSGVASSFSQNFRDLKQTVPSSSHQPSSTGELAMLETAPSAPDDDRLGFQATRHAQVKEPRREPNHQRANDDRLVKQFMKKERAKR